ncbi:hypothetical protein M2440_002759 [Methylorubrum extorquens]|nr:hypothetical protein [Methylorubrum extorquens]
MIAQEVGGQQRRDEARDEQRHEHGRRDGEPELLEVLAGDAGHEGNGGEDRDDGRGDGDDRKPDLVGGFERRAVGGFAHPHVADDVLDLDDGVIDEDAGHQRDREQADRVEREAEGTHHPEGRQHREWQRHRRDQGGAPIPQEQEHHDHGQGSALQQAHHRRVVVADGVDDAGVDQVEAHARILGVQILDALGHGDRDFGVARSHRPGDGKAHHRLAVEAGEGARLLGRVHQAR